MTGQVIHTLLLIEASVEDARSLREAFDDEGLHGIVLDHVQSMAAAEQRLHGPPVDIIVLDLSLPDANGLEAVRRARAAAPHVPVVVLTASDDQPQATLALKEGAQDYLVKGQIDARGLMRCLRYAVARQALEEELFVEKERAQVTLSSIGDAVICADSAGQVTFLNPAACRLTGWSNEEALGHAMGEVFHVLDAESGEPAPKAFENALMLDETVHLPLNCTLVRRDGGITPVEDSIAPIHDREGRVTGTVAVFRDVSAAQALSQELRHSAQHDSLTGLPNRELFKDRVSQAIALAARHAKKVAVLFLDLDGFKHINDSLGHSTGDKVLESIAARLVGCVRGSDTVSRQGGDEFVVLLSEVDQELDIAGTATRMLQAVAGAHTIGASELHITTSIGVSIYPDDGASAEDLVKNADTAMYQAKAHGRGGFRFFTTSMNVRAVERQSIEQDLRRAIERQELVLHYQPKIDLRTGTIVGVEALVRWVHPTRGMVPPDKFIPVAEDCGLIVPIGRWVLHEACRQARAWGEPGLPRLMLAVNISAMEFRDDHFLKGVFAILDETGLDPHALELEMTESALMKRVDATEAILSALRTRGIQLAVDDFGTGYSSLSYLKRFSVDTLKIDQSFVREIGTAPDDRTIVLAVIGIGRSLKLRVIAEGVETPEELAFLQLHHCDEAQGYYFSRPLPAPQFEELLRTHASQRSPVLLD